MTTTEFLDEMFQAMHGNTCGDAKPLIDALERRIPEVPVSNQPSMAAHVALCRAIMKINAAGTADDMREVVQSLHAIDRNLLSDLWADDWDVVMQRATATA